MVSGFPTFSCFSHNTFNLITLPHHRKETARWIKYEEDVEEGSDRWGRPHVASLSFHSLLNLRRCLETGETKLRQ